MNRESISGRNFTCLIILMVLCGSLISGAFTVKQDSWISILLMGVMYLPIIIMYCRLTALYPGKSLFEIIDTLFGRKAGAVFIFLLTFYTIITSGFVLQNYTEFTVVISLQETPKIPIMIVLLLSAIFLASKGTALLGRWALIVCAIIVVQLFVTLLLSFNVADFGHIQPVFNHPLPQIANNSWALGGVAIGEIVIALALTSRINKGSSSYKIFIPGVIIGTCLLILITLRNLMVLGPELEEKAQFAAYMAIRIIRVGSFLERVESSISFVYVLLGITKIILYVTVAAMGVSHLLKSTDYKKLLFPVSLFNLAIGYMVFKNALEMYDFVWVYRFLTLPFQVFIPIIIWIAAEIRKKKSLVPA